MRKYSEDALVEQPAIALFARPGYETINTFHETPHLRGEVDVEGLEIAGIEETGEVETKAVEV